MLKQGLLAVAAVLATMLGLPSMAQDYPNRAERIVVPWSPGAAQTN